MTKSAFLSSCRSPTSKDRVNNGFVEFVDDGWRVVQKAAATEPFYDSNDGRYDTVLVSTEKKEDGTENTCRPEKISVRFGKTLAFLRAVSDPLENGLCARKSKKAA